MAVLPERLGIQAAKQRYIVLDSWRGIAAICVALMHLQTFNRLDSHIGDWTFISNSFLFVDFFFVLSGFVITHSYYRSLQDARGLRVFMIKRFARLWPLHFFTLILSIMFLALRELVSNYYAVSMDNGILDHGSQAFIRSLLFNLTLAHDIWPFQHNDFNGPSWSISVEFYTYLLFALLAVYLRDWNRFLWFAVSFSGAIIIYNGSSNFLENQELGIFRCFYGFFLGCITYRIRNWQVRSNTLVELTAVMSMYLIISAVGLGAANIITPFVFSSAIFVFAQERGAISRLLAAKPFRLLGSLSYSIYMTHMFFVLFSRYARTFFERVLHQEIYRPHGILIVNQWMMDIFTLLFVVVVVGFSFITYRYVEAPWKSRIHRSMLSGCEIGSHG